jgi:TRAP-type mannitol/chloroaromatic compound transport system permease small subunit
LKPLIAFAHAVDKLNEKIGLIAVWMVLLASMVSAGNAFIRYFPPTSQWSSNAWLELQWYFFAYTVMLGAAYTLKMNEHVRVDLVYGSRSPRGKAWIDLLGTLFFLMPAMLYAMMLSWPFFLDAFKTGEVSQNAGGLVRWYAKVALPLGFGLVALQGVSEIIKRIGFLTGQYNMDTHYERPVQ